MKIFTPCWGNKHLDLFERALMRSLLWPKNNKAIQGAEFIFIVENERESDHLKALIDGLGKVSATVYMCPQIDRYNVGVVLMGPLIETVRRCLKTNEAMLMSTPDFIWGDGTIDVFKRVGSDLGSVVSIAHMRVLPTFVEAIHKSPGLPLNRELMTYAFMHPHVSWSDSDHRFHYSGIKKTKLSEDMYAVRHWLPSPFYVNFVLEDLNSFEKIDPIGNKAPGFGMWDHLWPEDIIKAGRLRFIGDSDVALMLEVTDADKNVPPISDRTDFLRDSFHHLIQSQFISIFKGE